MNSPSDQRTEQLEGLRGQIGHRLFFLLFITPLSAENRGESETKRNPRSIGLFERVFLLLE